MFLHMLFKAAVVLGFDVGFYVVAELEAEGGEGASGQVAGWQGGEGEMSAGGVVGWEVQVKGVVGLLGREDGVAREIAGSGGLLGLVSRCDRHLSRKALLQVKPMTAILILGPIPRHPIRLYGHILIQTRIWLIYIN